MFSIISKVLVVFLIMALGIALNKLKILPTESRPYIVDLLLYAVCPCLIFSTITEKSLDKALALDIVSTLIMAVIFYVLAFFIALFLSKRVLKVEPIDQGVFIFAFSSCNAAFMGYPITQSIFGDELLYLMIIYNIIVIIYLYSLGPVIIHMGERKSVKFDKKLIFNPSVIASLISILMLIFGIKFPGPIFEGLDMIGDMVVPLSMILIGMQLSEANILSILKNPTLIIGSLIKLLILPLITFLTVNWLPLTVNVKVTAVFAAAFPSAVISSVTAMKENRNPELASEYVAFTTAISVITIPFVALLLHGYYGI